MIKVAFLGTPLIGAAALQSLINHENIKIMVVVTNPDKKIGRSHSILQPSPVAELAQKNKLNIIKTSSINKDVNELKKYKFDYIITCAFGQFLSDEILSLPKFKSLNIHGSLLPEGRGGAPIHWAIINGKKKTGISIMEMISEMDAGNYYSQYEIKINIDDTVDTLFDKMSNLIFEKTALSIVKINDGEKSIPQDKSKVSFWMNIKKQDAKVDFSKKTQEVLNQIRGLTSKPGAWSKINGKIIKIHSAVISENIFCSYEPGRIMILDSDGIQVATGDGLINIKEITIEGNKKTSTNIFCKLDIINVGDIFS
ncbi:MAG: methionyl-tRNA formyltransferase [Mycoplasmataceae bacterium]|nr:methionyl-tRNA formyltransferase [Mycoplasmataceae bacterium]